MNLPYPKKQQLPESVEDKRNSIREQQYRTSYRKIIQVLASGDEPAAVHTQPHDEPCEEASADKPYERRDEQLERDRYRAVPGRRSGLLVHSPRGRGRGGRRSAERVHHAHDHALPRLAARRHAADEVEEPRAVEPELGVGTAAAAAGEPAHRARRAAAVVVAAAHQEDRVVLRVLEI